MPGAAFTVRGLTKVYESDGTRVEALRGVDLDVPSGRINVLLGPSGSGKSTLLNILGGLDHPTAGSVRFLDHDLTTMNDTELTAFRRDHVGFVFQFYNLIPPLTARENVTLFDQSCYSKFIVQGRDAETVLNRICANDVAVPVGRCVYTQWLNERGTIEEDVTVTRISEDSFFVIAADYTQNVVHNWLKGLNPQDSHCFATDVTSGYAILSVQGPKSRELLGRLTKAVK